jgi:hypothetical protein
MTETNSYYELHGVILRASSPDHVVRERIDAVFGPFACQPDVPDVDMRFHLVEALPSWRPTGTIVSDSPLLRCALDGALLSAYFPRWGLVAVNLTSGAIQGELLPAALDHYGAFDDMLIILLGPLLRRRGFFSIHAFAAALRGQAVLLVGDIGAGKTTTGLSLLQAGWSLVSNDSPLLCQLADGVSAYAYPGLLSAYDDTLIRFPSLHRFVGQPDEPPAKRSFGAHQAFPGVWQHNAQARVLLFPKIVTGLASSRAEPMMPKEALLALIPNSIERWDRAYIPHHLALLQALVQQASTYRLLLAPDVPTLPSLIENLL